MTLLELEKELENRLDLLEELQEEIREYKAAIEYKIADLLE